MKVAPKRPKDKSREKRRKKKKKIEAAIGRLNQPSYLNSERISQRLGITTEENRNIRSSLPKFGPLRMDSPSLTRARIDSSSSRVDKIKELPRIFLRDESPTPPRTIGSVVTSCNFSKDKTKFI